MHGKQPAKKNTIRKNYLKTKIDCHDGPGFLDPYMYLLWKKLKRRFRNLKNELTSVPLGCF
jgi:hypothetical protein